MAWAWVLLVLVGGWLWSAAPAHAERAPSGPSPTLMLGAAVGPVDVWPAVRLLHDPTDEMDLAAVRRQAGRFEAPTGPAGNLGPQRHAVWLRVPLALHDGADTAWVFDIDYPSINRADLYVVADGQLRQHLRMGSTVAWAERPLQVRSHAADLRLEPGRHYELYLRVLTESSAILPLSLTPRDAFHQREERVQMAQGLIFGLAGALLAYSLAHWFSLGSRLFAFYAFMLIGSGTFFLVFFGVAQQHLGLVLDGVWRKLPPMSVLMALVAGGQFVSLALETRQDHPRLHRGLMAISALAAFSLLASLSGLVDYRLSALSSTLLGTVMVVVSIPAAWQRARAGDRVGIYMLAGWGAYMIGAITMAALLRGLLPARPWTMNLFQWGWLVEMLFWVRVLGVHIASVRHAAEAADAERKAMAALAHSDPLTGLPNRRGLEAALALRLADARGTAAVAVYLLDLDGFKPVNDRLGHEAGDRLLVHVSERLRRQLRPNDVVARLGGDEFVVVVGGLPATADADRVGHKLLAAFDEPFGVQQQACRVGATIGYSMVRRPGTTAGELLRQADAAMYAGKQAGRGVVRPFQVAAAPAVAGKPFKPEVTDAAADIGATAAAGAARPRAASPADNALA